MTLRILGCAIAIIVALGGPARALDCAAPPVHTKMIRDRIPTARGDAVDPALVSRFLKRLARAAGRDRIWGDAVWVWRFTSGLVWVILYLNDRGCEVLTMTTVDFDRLMRDVAGTPI